MSTLTPLWRRESADNQDAASVDVSKLPLPPKPRRAVWAEFFRWNKVAFGWVDDNVHEPLENVGEIFRFPWPRVPPKIVARFPKYAAAQDVAEPGWSGEWVMVNTPELVRELYALPPDALDHSGAKNFLRFVMGINSPFMLDGAPHQKIRRALVSQLTPAHVDRYRDISVQVLDRLIDNMPVGAPIQMHDYYAAFAQEIILRVVFGEDDQDELDAMRQWLNLATRHGMRSFAPLFAMFTHLGQRSPFTEGRDEIPNEDRYRIAYRIREGADHVIYRQMEKLRKQPNDSIASELLRRAETDDFWTDKIIRDVIATTLVAGHDTSVNAYSWATDFLLHNDDKCARLVAEARAGRDDSYAKACNFEALRLKPPVWAQMIIARRDVALGGYRIRKGAFVWITQNVIHRDLALYPDSREFKPERFLYQAVPDQYSFIAFSAGRHRCPGRTFYTAEASLVLHRVFGRLDMEPLNPQVSRTRMEAAFFNRPHESMPVIIRNRRAANDVPVSRSATHDISANED